MCATNINPINGDVRNDIHQDSFAILDFFVEFVDALSPLLFSSGCFIFCFSFSSCAENAALFKFNLYTQFVFKFLAWALLGFLAGRCLRM